MREALDALGCRLKVTEWFEDEPKGKPYTFKVEVETGDYGLSKAQQQTITDTIEATKNARSHLSMLKTIGRNTGIYRVACTAIAGETIGIFPYTAKEIEQVSNLRFSGATVSGEKIVVYPPVIKQVSATASWFVALGTVYEKDTVTIYQRGII